MSSGFEGAARAVAARGLQNAPNLLPRDFTRQGSDKFECTFTGPANLKNSLAGGGFDVIIAAAPMVAELEISGSLQAASCRTAARAGIRVGERAGAPKHDLSAPEDFINSARNIVSTHASMPTSNGSMHELIGGRELDLVKPHACLINARSGGIGPPNAAQSGNLCSRLTSAGG